MPDLSSIIVKTVRIVSALLFLSVLLVSPVADAQASNDVVWYETASNGQPLIHLYFFWSKKCPHCLKAQPDIAAMEKELPWLKLHSLQLLGQPENIKTYIDMASLFDDDARSVPAFMFCGNLLSGYESKQSTGQQLRSYLQSCYRFAQENNPDNSTVFVLDENSSASLDIPLLGSIATKDYSLPALTFFIAGMDAFNPCALFVRRRTESTLAGAAL